MSKMTPGNRLYIYQLLSKELGVGRQTLLPRVEEVFAADGIHPEDLGCESVREVLEQMDECIKLTVFKKGYVYATVLANEDYDRALEKLSQPSSADKAAASGRPWKRHKGAKDLKPQKPRHREPKPEPKAEIAVDAQVDDASAGEKPVEPEIDDAPAPSAEDDMKATSVADVASVADAGDVPGAPDDVSAIEAVAEALPTGEFILETEFDPSADLSQTPAPAGGTASEDAATRAPSISLTITYVPEPEASISPEPDSTADAKAGAAPDDAPAPRSVEPSPSPAPAEQPSGTRRRTSGLPQDFRADVRCPDKQLSTLYQLLPPNVDPLASLEEDFVVARSAGLLEGTRSSVKFPLRWLRPDGTPVTATIRRSAKTAGGKSWVLAEVDAGPAEEIGLEGLPACTEGAWEAFLANAPQATDYVSPSIELAHFAVIGSPQAAFEDLASLAAPEDWGDDLAVLGQYLPMTFVRVRAEDKLTVASDGSLAAFDTGLLTAGDEAIYACFSPHADDIPWQLEGFCSSKDHDGELGRRLAEAIDPLPAPARYLSSLDEISLVHDPQIQIAPSLGRRAVAMAAPLERALHRARRSPRWMTLGYDPVADDVKLLLPLNEQTVAALAPTEGGYQACALLPRDAAYACARVVSAEQPSWLR